MPLFEGLALGADKHSVVIEFGQAYTKCGFVNEYSPRAIIRSEVLSQTPDKVSKLIDIKNTEKLYHALKEYIENIYFRYLAVNPKDRKVVIVESVFCPTYFRNTLAKVLFQHFDIPGLLVVPQHLMCLLTLMLQSALVVDVGYIETTVIPVIEGVTLLDSVQFGPQGSKAIHERILDELIEHNAIIKPSGDSERPLTFNDKLTERVIEDIKVRTCFVAPFDRAQKLVELKSKPSSSAAEEIASTRPKDISYPVDGEKLLTIPGQVRENACQVLFEFYGTEANLATLILEALYQCPRDSRTHLAENIVLVGGTTLLPGFRHRLMHELQALIKADNRYQESLHLECFKFHKTPCKENYASWLGAAVFGSTDAIALRAISRDQYFKSNGSVLNDWSDWWPQSRTV